MTHKGNSSFKTVFGGVITIILYVLMTWVWVFTFIRMIRKTSIQTNQTRTYINMHDEKINLEYDLGDSNLKFIFGVYGHPLGNESFSSYVRVSGIFSDNTQVNPETNQTYQRHEPFPIVEWSEDEITDFFEGEGIIDIYPSAAYLCLDTEIVLKRLKRSTERRDLRISIEKCGNGSSAQWKTDGEIERFLQLAEIVFLFKNNYFQFNNIGTPIKQFLQEKRIGVRSGTQTIITIGVKNNDYVLKDTLTQFTQEEGRFLSFSHIDSQFINEYGRQFGFIILEIDNESEIYERSVYSLWEYIGQIGGIYEIIEVFTAFIVTTYNGKMFMLSLVNDKIKMLASNSEK